MPEVSEFFEEHGV